MNQLSPELIRHVLHPAMHEKLLLRAAEVVELGWTGATAARDTEGSEGPGHGAAGQAQTDAPYARGRLIITPLGDGRFAVEVTQGADKWRIGT